MWGLPLQKMMLSWLSASGDWPITHMQVSSVQGVIDKHMLVREWWNPFSTPQKRKSSLKLPVIFYYGKNATLKCSPKPSPALQRNTNMGFTTEISSIMAPRTWSHPGHECETAILQGSSTSHLRSWGSLTSSIIFVLIRKPLMCINCTSTKVEFQPQSN